MDKPAETPAQISERRRYQWTLVLFAVVAAATVIWFKRHIEAYVTETLIVGGTISLWGLWKLLWSGYEDASGENRKTITRRLLGNPAATRALYFAALILAFLHFTTSSIYLRIAGAAPGESGFEVQVIEDGKVVMGPFEMRPGETIGNPIVPSGRTRTLTYQIIEPRGFLALTKVLAPWGAHDLDVPGDFKRKKLNILALVPDEVLFADLPSRSETGGERYFLEIAFGGKTALLEDYSKAIVTTGAADEDLPSPSTVMRDAHIRQVVTDYFLQAGIVNPDGPISALMSAEAQKLGSADLAPGTALKVVVGTWANEAGVRTKVPSFTCNFPTPAEGGLHTLVIGVARQGTCK